MSDKYIQLKNPQGDYLYPRTDWSMILNAPGIPSVALVNSKQDQLTALNAGSNISITTVGGVLKINSTANTTYTGLSGLPSLNGVTIRGRQYPYTFNLVSYEQVGRDSFNIKGPDGVILMALKEGEIVTSAFDSRVKLTNVSSLVNDAGYITSSYHDIQKQDVLTSENAGSNITITTVEGVLKINATGSGGTTDYTVLTNRPQINNLTLIGSQTAAYYKLTKVDTQSSITSFYDDSNNVAFSISDGYIRSTNFDSQAVLNRIALLESGKVAQSDFNTALATCVRTNDLPVATTSTLGCIKVGTHLSISSGVLSVTPWNDTYMPYATTSRNITGNLSPLDVAWNMYSGNSIFCGNGSQLDVTYSSDGGTTWSSYGLTDYQKKEFLWNGPSNQVLYLKGPSHPSGAVSAEAAALQKLRVELIASSIYGQFKKLYLWVSTNYSNGVTVKVETLTNTKAGTEYIDADWTTVISSMNITGWSGWNVLNLNLTGFGGTTGSYIKRIRLTFSHTSVSQGTGFQLLRVVGAMSTVWSAPSNMARTGHLYSWDGNQNVTFPAELTTVGAITSQSTITAAGDILTSGTITGNNIPAPPSANGTYYLKCVKTSNSTTYSWATLS